MNPLETLLNESLLRTGHVGSACLIDKSLGGKLLASTNGFLLSVDQVDLIISTFVSPSKMRENDLFFGGRKFECVRADAEAIYAKNEKNGILIVQTAQLIIMATYNEHMYPAVAVEAIEQLSQYFKAKGK